MKPSTARSLDIEDSISEQEEPLSSEEKLNKLLSQVSKKLSENSSIESKFDILMYKVEKIEESQDKILDQLSGLHEAVYNPDNGLFSRIKEVKQENDKEINIINGIKNSQEEEKKK